MAKKNVFKGQSGIQSLRYVVEKEVTARLLLKAVAWKNILYVDMKLDRFKICLPDMEHWIGIDKVDVPNVCVLEELVHQVIGKVGLLFRCCMARMRSFAGAQGGKNGQQG